MTAGRACQSSTGAVGGRKTEVESQQAKVATGVSIVGCFAKLRKERKQRGPTMREERKERKECTLNASERERRLIPHASRFALKQL